MSTDNYIVLHRKSQPSLGDPFGADFSFSAVGSGSSPEPEVTVESLDTKDIAQLRKDPSVEAIAPVFPTQLIAPTSSEAATAHSESGVTWGIQAVKATESPFTGEGITVAVLDTGIDADHPAFAGIEIIQEDFTGHGNGDRHGHGTHVAGTIFGRTVNGFRFGVAQGVKRVLIGKVLGDNGRGSTDGIIRGIQWAYDNRAHIICMSLGMAFPQQTQRFIQQGWPADLAADRALQGYRANLRVFDHLVPMLSGYASMMPIAHRHSALVIAAAGNESRRHEREDYEVSVAPPAAAEGVISVGALGELNGSLSVASFSNTGCNVSAPGVAVYSAIPRDQGSYRNMNGTSMAAPHVAGVAALWAEKMLRERRVINAYQLGQLVAGQTTQEGLVDNFDPYDVGLGLVRSPLQ